MKPYKLVLALALFFAGTPVNAQKESVVLKNFKIAIENVDGGIKMTCKKGCAWKELTFSLKNYKPQAIDENGMTELNSKASKKDENPSGFLFTLTKTENGIELKGIKGTAWGELKFNLQKNQKQVIDQLGMKNKKGKK